MNIKISYLITFQIIQLCVNAKSLNFLDKRRFTIEGEDNQKSSKKIDSLVNSGIVPSLSITLADPVGQIPDESPFERSEVPTGNMQLSVELLKAHQQIKPADDQDLIQKQISSVGQQQPMIPSKSDMKEAERKQPSIKELLAEVTGVDEYSDDPFQPPEIAGVVAPSVDRKAPIVHGMN